MTIDNMDIDLDNRRNNSTLAAWGRLVRLHTAIPTSLVAMATYITTQSVTLTGGTFIILIGSTMHMSICTMNDYLDYESDKNDIEKTMRPLVNGDVSLEDAKQFIFISAGTSMTLAMVAGFYVFLVTLAGFIFASVYNYYSGEAVHGDVWYVAAILTLGLLGVVVAGTYTMGTVAIMVVLLIHGFYQVQEGHMKDLGVDEDNIIQWLGVRKVGDRRIIFPDGFVSGTYFLKLVELALLLFIVYSNLDVITSYSSAAIGVVAVAYTVNLGLYFYSLINWLSEFYKRGDVVRYITLHEVSAVMLIMLSIAPYSPHISIFFMVMAPIYLFITNYFIHDDAVSPDI